MIKSRKEIKEKGKSYSLKSNNLESAKLEEIMITLREIKTKEELGAVKERP